MEVNLFITALIRAQNLSLFRHINLVNNKHAIPCKYIFNIIFHLRLVFRVFFSGLPTKTMYATLLSANLATRLAHNILFAFFSPRKIVEQYRSLGYSLCSFLHSHVTSSLLGPNTLLSFLFLSPFSLHLYHTQRCSLLQESTCIYPHIIITINPHTAHNHSGHYTVQYKALSVPYSLSLSLSLRGLSPQANYTDRAAAAGRRS